MIVTSLANPSRVPIGTILLLIGCLLPRIASAQSYTLAPAPFQYVLATSGAIIPNGCVWTFAAGTTSAITTYADTAGTPNGNPIIADNFGRFVAYLLPGTNYKFQYETTPCAAPSTHGAILKVQDNIQGTPAAAANVDIVGTAGTTLTAGQCAFLSDGSGGNTAGQWYKCDSANTYSSTKPDIGIPIANIVAATQGTIRIAGYVTGLSSLVVGSTYYAGTAGAITATAPTNVRAIGVADTPSSLIVVANPSTAMAQPTVVTSTVTGAQNNFAPGLVGSTILRMNNATLTTISGIAAGYDGQRLIIESVGAGQVDLQHQNASSSAANRLTNFATSGLTSLAAGSGRAEYIYDLTATTWQLVAHNQGAWITPTFAAGSFGGSGGMTWTVGSTQVNTQAYWLKDRTLTISLDVGTGSAGGATTVSGGQLSLTYALPAGFLAAKQMGTGGWAIDNSTNVGTRAVVIVGGTSLLIRRVDAANWAAATTATSVGVTVAFEVQ